MSPGRIKIYSIKLYHKVIESRDQICGIDVCTVCTPGFLVGSGLLSD